MTQFASATVGPGNSVQHGSDSDLFVRFYKNPESGKPHVRIQAPGDKLNIYDSEVRDHDKERFPGAWKAFAEGVEQYPGQTPLEEVAWVNEGLKLELNGHGIWTIEQLASISDESASRFMGAAEFRDRAKKMVAEKKTLQETSALEARFDAMQMQIADLQKQNLALKEKRGPGRPRKED